MLLQVHDELVFEVPREEVSRLAPVVREVMESAMPLDVPLTVDIKVGDDWESMTPLTRVDAIRAEAAEAPEIAPAANGPSSPVLGESLAPALRVSVRSTTSTAYPRVPYLRDMPELPEVETVARDLRRHVVGATITGARVSWERTLRNASPADFAAALSSRTIEAVGRRGKQLVVELSGGRAMTIHLKMTGQLFVVPAPLREDAYVRVVLELGDGRELRFRDIRKFGRIGVYERDAATGELRDAAGPVFGSTGPEPLDEAFTSRSFALCSAPGGRASSPCSSTRHSSPASATSTRTKRSGRPGSIPFARLRPCVRTTHGVSIASCAGSSPRRSSGGAARSTTTRDRMATGRCRSGFSSTSGPASHVPAAAGPSGGSSSGRVRRTSARGASGCRQRIGPARGGSSPRWCPGQAGATCAADRGGRSSAVAGRTWDRRSDRLATKPRPPGLEAIGPVRQRRRAGRRLGTDYPARPGRTRR